MNNASRQPPSADEIRSWIVEKLAERLRRDPNDFDLDAPLVAHGVDSMQFVVLVGELEDWLGCRFASNPLSDFPSVNSLALFIARQLSDGRTLIDPASKVTGQ